MKENFLLIVCLFSICIYGQNQKTINWINKNAIEIEDSNPNSELLIFQNTVPKNFAAAKVFGFGEATHHGKEFFDIKIKFFKYLVEHNEVKVFIIEDSYTSEESINEWISGGNGNVQTIAKSFSIVPWKCKEMIELLDWMRLYNVGKSEDEMIRFYGMDIQNAKGIDIKIIELIEEYQIPVSVELKSIINLCANKKIKYNDKNDWADTNIPKLEGVKRKIIDFQRKNSYLNNNIFNSTVRALDYLIKYTYYVQNHYSQDRDLKMFENVKWIVENESKNGKVFVWAHNEHINNRGFANYSKRSIYNLGKHLKKHYQEDYYSMGFDFGKGILGGYLFKQNENPKWTTYRLDEPVADTYAETLSKANYDIYFIDIQKAVKDNSIKFFKRKNNQLVLGAAGYDPVKDNLYKKKFSEMFDGLIYINEITVPNYNLRE